MESIALGGPKGAKIAQAEKWKLHAQRFLNKRSFPGDGDRSQRPKKLHRKKAYQWLLCLDSITTKVIWEGSQPLGTEGWPGSCHLALLLHFWRPGQRWFRCMPLAEVQVQGQHRVPSRPLACCVERCAADLGPAEAD